jgi:hypothetical protein
MSTSTLPTPAFGHTLFAEASRFLAAMFTAPKATAPINPEPIAAIAAPARSIWNLYRMSAGTDSVNPELFVHHIVQD